MYFNKRRKQHGLLVPSVLALSLILVAPMFFPAPARGSGLGLKDKIAQTRWADVRGVNFIPSYSANTYDIWRNYDHDLVDRDLGLAASVGFNSVRIWLNYAAFEELGPKMVEHVDDALSLCAKYHLRAVIVLFDSCGIRPRKDARWMTARQA